MPATPAARVRDMTESDPVKAETAARRRGRRPADADQRRARVVSALADLEDARVPFTMADVAERAGISRATLYRDAGLRDLIGRRGDSPAARPVSHKSHTDLAARADALAEERRVLRRALRAAEKRALAAEQRVEELEVAAVDAERSARSRERLGDHARERIRADAYAEGFTAGAQRARPGGRSGGDAALAVVAARLPRPALVNARRALARALHPDLFTSDPAASLLATELLKQINALVGPGEPGRKSS